jgi:hypothetical protein
MSGVHLELPVALVDQIIDEVTARVRAELETSSPWLTRTQAADYLSVPVSRLEKDRSVPAHRWDGRVFYDRRELDAWLTKLDP